MKESSVSGILVCTTMIQRVRSALTTMTLEDWAVSAFGASFLIGVWYAFPMVNTITDVWAFGGGVLRAMEAGTLLPGYGVAYGTLSFYQNYVAMVAVLSFGLLFFGFDITALKTALVLNPHTSLLVPRLTSALTAMVLLVIVYRFLKVHVYSLWWRLALLMLVFGNVLAVLLTRSGKMWILSITLGVVSFIYLYRALTEERERGVPGRFSAISIVTAFLAMSNFTFAGLFLVNVPIIFSLFPKTLQSLRRLFSFVAVGGIAFLIIFALNAQNTIEQVSGFVLQFFSSAGSEVARVRATLSPLESFMVNARQAIESFPLLLLAVVPALYAGIRDKVLANLAVFYIVLYMIAVSLIFRADDGIALNVRHIFPVGFFLLFLLVACKPPARFVSISLLVVGGFVYVYTLVLLSIPTTYNTASAFIVTHYGEKQIRIDERIFELTLPMNKSSYALFSDASCGSTCQHRQQLEADIAFRPLVITNESDQGAISTLPPPDVVVVERAIEGCTPVARFGNTVPDTEVFDIDINLGRMLMPSFYTLHQLGKNIYVYESGTCERVLESPIWR